MHALPTQKETALTTPETQPPEYPIFLSYSRSEMYFAEDVTLKLQAAGYDIWFDLQRLEPGALWREDIQQGLDESGALILIASRRSMASPYVAIEWRKAMDRKQDIHIILFEELNFGVRDYTIGDETITVDTDELLAYASSVIDGRVNFKGVMQRLIAALHGEPIARDPVPAPNRWGLPQRLPFWVGFVLFSAALLIVFLLWAGIASFPLSPFLTLAALLLAVVVAREWRIFIRRESFLGLRTSLLLALLSPVLLSGQPSIRLSVFAFGWVMLFLIAWVASTRSRAVSRWSPRGEGRRQRRLGRNKAKKEQRTDEPPSFRVIYNGVDVRVARVIERRMRRAGLRQLKEADQDEAAQHYNILIMSNYLEEDDIPADLDDHAGRWIILTVSQILHREWHARFSDYQWVDFRQHAPRHLKLLAQELMRPQTGQVSLGFSLLTTPQSFGEVLLPLSVRIFTAFYLFVVTLNIVVIGLVASGAFGTVFERGSEAIDGFVLVGLLLLFLVIALIPVAFIRYINGIMLRMVGLRFVYIVTYFTVFSSIIAMTSQPALMLPFIGINWFIVRLTVRRWTPAHFRVKRKVREDHAPKSLRRRLFVRNVAACLLAATMAGAVSNLISGEIDSAQLLDRVFFFVFLG